MLGLFLAGVLTSQRLLLTWCRHRSLITGRGGGYKTGEGGRGKSKQKKRGRSFGHAERGRGQNKMFGSFNPGPLKFSNAIGAGVAGGGCKMFQSL